MIDREHIVSDDDTGVGVNERAFEGALATSKALIQPGSIFHTDDIAEASTDLERAQQLVEAAKADGFDGKVELVGGTAPPRPDVSLAADAMLRASPVGRSPPAPRRQPFR